MLFVMALTPLYLVTLPRREATTDKAQEKAKQEESAEEESEESSEGQPAAA